MDDIKRWAGYDPEATDLEIALIESEKPKSELIYDPYSDTYKVKQGKTIIDDGTEEGRDLINSVVKDYERNGYINPWR